MPDDRNAYERNHAPQRRVRTEPRPASRTQAGRSMRAASPRSQERSTSPERRSRYAQERAASADRQPRNAKQQATAERQPRNTQEQPAQRTAPAKNMPAYKRKIARWRQYGVYAFAVVMIVGGLVGILFPVRPTYSEVEKRNLQEFPVFTIERFLDGAFFDDLSTWFSDTFPLREPLVQLDHAVESLYGFQSSVQVYGGNVQADELPVEGSATEPVVREVVDPPTEQAVQDDIQGNIMGGLYVKDGAAYSMYYFDNNAVSLYTQAVNTAADRLDGISNVYSILIPNNSGVMLDDSEIFGTNQQEALKYFYSLFNEKVTVVETYDEMRAHNDEYLFFRTDHHWTQLGAYYAYVCFCRAKGIEPSDITKWEQHDYEPFLGSFYQELFLDSMAEHPDTVHVYIPTGTNEMTYWDEYDNEYTFKIIEDGTDYGVESKYMIYIYGDQPLCRIDNPNITDGSSCLLVKDSYGCAFAPLLVDNYQTVYIADFRNTTVNIPDFAYEHQIQDVIFLNNMTIAGTQTAAETLLDKVS